MSTAPLKVLFVFSGNSARFPISPFLIAQAESLRENGVEVGYFPINGKGWRYLLNIRSLRKRLKEDRPDLIHAHYSLCGWVAVLAAGGTPVVLSLMGDDAQGTFISKDRVDLRSWFFVASTWLIQPFVSAIIYKSPNLKKAIWRTSVAHLVPNGVRLDQFQVHPEGCRHELGLESGRKYVLFLGDPGDRNKNIALVRAALDRLASPDVELLSVYGISHNTVVKYMNSVDVFALCSFGEGSANVLKEAMACNCPIVSTPAGDAAWVLGDIPGCYIASHDIADFALKIQNALAFGERTKGRDRIRQLGLESGSIAGKLQMIYQRVTS